MNIIIINKFKQIEMRNLFILLTSLFCANIQAQCTFTVVLDSTWDCNSLVIQTSTDTYVVDDSMDITVVNNAPIIFSTNNCSTTSTFYIYHGEIDTITVEGESLWWAWAINCSTLPVELTSFKVIEEESKVLLIWELASQQNLRYINIIRNGEIIETIENTEETQLYWEYSDNFTIFGESYYQLEFVDYDGYAEFSSIEVITVKEPIKVSKDGNNYMFSLEDSNEEVIVMIVSMDGKVMKQSVWYTDSDLIITVEGLTFVVLQFKNTKEVFSTY
jgi:hypothetical protein